MYTLYAFPAGAVGGQTKQIKRKTLKLNLDVPKTKTRHKV